MENGKSLKEYNNFLNYWLDAKVYQPIFFSFRYRTSFALFGKINMIKSQKGRVFKSISIKYKRTYGLINFAIDEIISVKRENDGTVNQEAITIRVRLEAFRNRKDTAVFYELDEELILKNNEFIVVKIEKDVVNIDEKDDIYWKEQNPNDQIDICHSRTRP